MLRLAQATRRLVSRARRLTVRAVRLRVLLQVATQTVALQTAAQAQPRPAAVAPPALRAGRPAIHPVIPEADRAQHAIFKKVLRHRFTDLGASCHHDLGARLDGQHA